MILRYCGGYRIEHVVKLTLKQFSRMIKEAYALQSMEILNIAVAVRQAHHAEGNDYTAFQNKLEHTANSLREITQPKENVIEHREAKTDVSESDLEEFFS